MYKTSQSEFSVVTNEWIYGEFVEWGVLMQAFLLFAVHACRMTICWTFRDLDAIW